MPWHKGAPFLDPVTGRWVSDGEWYDRGAPVAVKEGAGTVPPPAPAVSPVEQAPKAAAAQAGTTAVGATESTAAVVDRYTQMGSKWRCNGCGVEKDSEKAIKLHLPHCKGHEEG
jgi:hypothetical protein